MRIVVLTGGIGGAKFLVGVRAHARAMGADVTAVVNVGDDVRMHGLQICPDLDSVMYTLGGAARPGARLGPGRRELGGQGRSWPPTAPSRRGSAWATRTPPPISYARRCSTPAIRSPPSPPRCATAGSPGLTLLPATDDRLETHVVVDVDGERKAIHFQEWWVRYRGALPTHRFVFVGADAAKPAPGVLEAIARGRRGAARPQQPGGQHRPDPGRGGGPRRGGARPGPGGRRLADHRRLPGARHGRQMPGTLGVEVSAAGVGRALRSPRRRRPAGRLAGRRGRRGRHGPRRRDQGRPALDDRRADHGPDGRRRAGPGRRLVTPGTGPARRVTPAGSGREPVVASGWRPGYVGAVQRRRGCFGDDGWGSD